MSGVTGTGRRPGVRRADASRLDDDARAADAVGTLIGWRPVQGRVLLQDPTFELAKLRPRFDPELLDERPASIGVGPKRVSLAAGSIQREHELLVEPLAQRHLLHPFGQVADRLAVTSEQQLQVDASFGRRPPQLVEPGGLTTGEVHAGDVLERFTSPQRQRILGLVQCLAQRRPAGEGLERCERLHGSLESVGIDLIRFDEQGVATGPRLQQRRPVGPGGTQGLAQVRDLNLEGVGRIPSAARQPRADRRGSPRPPSGPGAAGAR